eukprot:149461-Amphidinium_carterae.1
MSTKHHLVSLHGHAAVSSSVRTTTASMCWLVCLKARPQVMFCLFYFFGNSSMVPGDASSRCVQRQSDVVS